jgi:hypothetical protein
MKPAIRHPPKTGPQRPASTLGRPVAAPEVPKRLSKGFQIGFRAVPGAMPTSIRGLKPLSPSVSIV